MTLPSFVARVVKVLDDAGVPYMLTGSLAAAFYSVSRATQDVDVVIQPDRDGVERIVRGLQNEGCYVDREVAVEAFQSRSQFNAIDPVSGWKVDFVVRKNRRFSRTEFERRTRSSLLGIEVSLASLEGLLIATLEWSRLGDPELQRRDILELIERRWDALDLEYIERWIAELDLTSDWSSILARAGRG